MKIIYDIIQRFEIVNGVPCLVSTNIKMIEGGESLISIAQKWLYEWTNFQIHVKQDYIGYKILGSKRYQLILVQREQGLQISFASDDLSDDLTSFPSGEKDKLFSYMTKHLVYSKGEICDYLDKICEPFRVIR